MIFSEELSLILLFSVWQPMEFNIIPEYILLNSLLLFYWIIFFWVLLPYEEALFYIVEFIFVQKCEFLFTYKWGFISG